jgi:Holliday junction resolvasome RuvABC endonuclease subunit
MKHGADKDIRILAVSPSSRGFGFAVLEGDMMFVDWGVKSVQSDKNARCLVKVGELIKHYQPATVVLEDHLSKWSRRSPRIRTLLQQIIELASAGNVDVALYSLEQVIGGFFGKGTGTKHEIAQILAERFPEELGARLPPKRRLWMSEDYRVRIFDAVALGFTHIQKRGKRRSKPITPGSLK